MLNDLRNQLIRSCIFTAIFTVVLGLAYPALVTVTARIFFPYQSEGSLVRQNGAAMGSELVGQSFRSPQYFWGRPSATGPYPYNAASSSGSNAGPLNPLLLKTVRARAESLRKAHGGQAVPIDLVTASGSGLDPHISPAAAAYQAPRVSRNRGLPFRAVQALVVAHTEPPLWGFIGEPRVNVLKLNLGLDALARTGTHRLR